MPRTADKTDIPLRLTQAGRDLFSRQGYNATGIQAITDHAGVPKGSFYHYFASKEAFGAALLDAYFDAYMTRLDVLSKHPGLTGAQRLLTYFER